MRRPAAAAGSAVFFLVGPGIVVGLIPWLLTGWQVGEPVPYWAPMPVLGTILLVAGLITLIQAFMRFVVEGLGTPAPKAAPGRLVVGGLYHYIRNPITWRYCRPSSARRCLWASSVCCCTPQPCG
jgi:protein-S-isoprenylcysteine O-methyltransferase Ste14